MQTLPANAEIFMTQDGSPTLIWKNEAGAAVEKMHHSGGALSESLYIYGEALEEVLKRDWPVQVLSLGLGLGYNELIALALSKSLPNFKIWSFENQEFLRLGFRNWLEDKPTALSAVYDQILNGVAIHFKLESSELKFFAQASLQDGQLELRGPFPQDTQNVAQVSCFFYDAFSKKMSPELWLEDSMLENMQRLSAPDCVVTTYAATGALNRVLKKTGFDLLERKGFAGKRESTLAVRESSRNLSENLREAAVQPEN